MTKEEKEKMAALEAENAKLNTSLEETTSKLSAAESVIAKQGSEIEAAKKSEPSSSVAALDAFDRKFKPLIAQKIAAGLTQEQAIAAIRSQLREDEKNETQIAEEQLKAAKGE